MPRTYLTKSDYLKEQRRKANMKLYRFLRDEITLSRKRSMTQAAEVLGCSRNTVHNRMETMSFSFFEIMTLMDFVNATPEQREDLLLYSPEDFYKRKEQ